MKGCSTRQPDQAVAPSAECLSRHDQATLTIPEELWMMICELCNKEQLAELRLTCKTLADIATPALFREIEIGYFLFSLHNLQAISRSSLSKHVRQLTMFLNVPARTPDPKDFRASVLKAIETEHLPELRLYSGQEPDWLGIWDAIGLIVEQMPLEYDLPDDSCIAGANVPQRVSRKDFIRTLGEIMCDLPNCSKSSIKMLDRDHIKVEDFYRALFNRQRPSLKDVKYTLSISAELKVLQGASTVILEALYDAPSEELRNRFGLRTVRVIT